MRRLAVLSLLLTLAACGPPAADPLLRDVTADWGVSFRNSTVLPDDCALPATLGSGCAVLDADGDGRLDLYFVNGGRGRGDGAPNVLLLCRPDGTYDDVTRAFGVGDDGFGTGVAAGDIDNDGDTDLYVANWGPDVLYRNDGRGRFTNITGPAGLSGDHMTSSAAFLDYDADGWLDLFVVHYVLDDESRRCGSTALCDFCGPRVYEAVPDKLYRNRGDGTFEDVSRSSGIASRADPGLGVAVADLDGDGLTDIYVANDQQQNHLWINLGDGRFVDDAMARGAAMNAMGHTEASMGIDLGDADGDGRIDVFLTHLEGESNTLYTSAGAAGYRDRSGTSGLAEPSRALTGFGASFLDLDHDGWLDLAVANGRVKRGPPPPVHVGGEDWAPYAEPGLLMLNDGAGAFAPVADRAGTFTDVPRVGRGLVVADLDADGDLDVVVTSIAAEAAVYENVAPSRGRWIQLRVIDPKLRRDAIGARVEIVAGGRTIVRTVGSGWSYLCSPPAIVHAGLGDVSSVEHVDIVWPGGERERFAGPALDQVTELRRGEGSK